MPVKFCCRKCGKKYVDWGAAKLGYKCPDCEGEELVRVGQTETRPAKRPALKRRVRRPMPAFSGDEEVLVPELEGIEGETPEEEGEFFIEAEVKVEPDEFAIDEVLPADELATAEDADPEDLAFTGADEPIDAGLLD